MTSCSFAKKLSCCIMVDSSASDSRSLVRKNKKGGKSGHSRHTSDFVYANTKTKYLSSVS